MNKFDPFQIKSAEEPSTPTLFLSVQHPMTRCWAIFEENSSTAFFYLTEQEIPTPVSHCFVHNRRISDEEFPDNWEIGSSPPVPVKYANDTALRQHLTEDQIRIEWSATGDAAVAFIDNVPIALLILGEAHGYSRGVRAAGPYGNPWSDEAYSKRFGNLIRSGKSSSWH